MHGDFSENWIQFYQIPSLNLDRAVARGLTREQSIKTESTSRVPASSP
jgi:hypothetical protein